jgi:signal peptide peptidase SppA
MGNDSMNEDYPDQEQRAAVCYRQWREAHGESSADGTTVQCFSNHMGIWAIEPLWFQGMVAEYQAGRLHEQPVAAVDPDRRRYEVEGRVGIVPLMGPMTKGLSKFGGTSTVETRRALRHAMRNPDVDAIVLHIDSPGGHVAGVQDLADDVAYINRQKPVTAHIDDLGASAAYWVASQASRITANSSAEIGSIGTMAVLRDESKRLERLGIAVHVLSTGPYKGVGVDGAPLSSEALAYLTQRVHAINQHFLQAVERGRRFTRAQLDLVSDGRVHQASAAQHLGLINHVQSLEHTLDEVARPAQTLPGMGQPRTPQRPLSYYQSKLAVSR